MFPGFVNILRLLLRCSVKLCFRSLVANKGNNFIGGMMILIIGIYNDIIHSQYTHIYLFFLNKIGIGVGNTSPLVGRDRAGAYVRG